MPPEPDKKPEPATPPSDELATIKAELDALKKEKEAWSKAKPPTEDPDLNQKVKQQRDQDDKRSQDTKALESALTFNLTSSEFLKQNESVLPKDISDIFKAAEKETYGSAIEKSQAMKSAIIQSFFSQQSNVEYLTESQKVSLADFLKLTKNGKEEKSKDIYDNLFEPALGTLKRVKKAEELGRANSGLNSSTDAEQAYKNKLMQMGEKKFFKGKK